MTALYPYTFIPRYLHATAKYLISFNFQPWIFLAGEDAESPLPHMGEVEHGADTNHSQLLPSFSNTFRSHSAMQLNSVLWIQGLL